MRELPPLREIQPSVPFPSPTKATGGHCWVPVLACHSLGGCHGGDREGGTGPNFPRSPLQWISTHPCSLAWLWEVTSSVPVGFCRSKARGTEGCNHLVSEALALGPACKKRLMLSTKRLASEDSAPSTQSWGGSAVEKKLLLCPSG